MKKLLILSMLLCIMATVNVSAYQKTGHKGYSEIHFTTSEGKLLADVTSSDLKKAYEVMGKARFWGWKYYYFSLNAPATYIGDIIFSKTNRTSTPYTISYQIQEKEYAEESVSYTGNISIKASGNYKKIVDGGVSTEHEWSNEKTTSQTYTETSKIDFEVKPYHTLTYRVAGEAEITTCACKYYVFGIAFKKGAYEIVTVMTSYYELIEEKLENPNEEEAIKDEKN